MTRVGVRSQALAMELAMTEQALDPDRRERLVALRDAGSLVYEPEFSQVLFPFPQRLAEGRVASLVVAAPLLVESQVFGVLIAARRDASSFSSGECEFLRQLERARGARGAPGAAVRRLCRQPTTICGRPSRP